MEKPPPKNRILQTLTILAVLILFYAALWVLHREIRASRYDEVLAYLEGLPWKSLFLAFLFSMGSYLALGFHDVLGLVHIHRKLSLGRTLLTSFIAYTFSHNIGAAVLTGGGIRYRLYSAWGLTAGETASVLVICGATFWVGFIALGAVFFLLHPPSLPESQFLPMGSVFSLGILCLLIMAAYLLASVFVRRTIKILRWQFPTPTPSMAGAQVLVGGLDWVCSGAALYLLLPESSLDFPSLLAIYLLAQLIGFVSQVPGGLGILETVLVLAIAPAIPAPALLGALLAFRAVYYLIPFALGLAAYGSYEIFRNRTGFKRALTILNRWTPDFAPHLFAGAAFLAGGLLLFSNATPGSTARMAWLGKLAPLGLMETAHTAAGLCGAGLLVLARGLQRRLESAHLGALILLGTGALACVFKGFDYREALMLLALAAALLPCRKFFPRKASILQQTYPPPWVAAVLFVGLGSVWAGVFNYRHVVDYSMGLWFAFGPAEDPSRFLRGSLAATLALIGFSFASLRTSALQETELPRPHELERVSGLLKGCRRSASFPALWGDKALLFNRKATAFLSYAIEGKSWAALGDPVGARKEQEELVLKFKDLALRNGAWPVFFGVDDEFYQFHLDLGLTVVKIGEEALVPLKGFKPETLADGQLKGALSKFREKEEYAFEVLEADWVRPHFPEMRQVAEEWLSKNKSRAKGFLAGFYEEEALGRLPLAVVRREGRIRAFASLACAGAKEEAAAALLRSAQDAPSDLEDHLLLETLLWAKGKGFKRFGLGTAPLVDAEEGPLASFAAPLGGILSPLAAPGDLAAIRKEKERFNPEWEPRYIALPGNLPLGTALDHLRSLVNKTPRSGWRHLA